MRRVLAHPSGVLLAVQLAGVLVYPFLAPSPLGRLANGVIAIVVLAIATVVVSQSPTTTWVGVLLGLPVAALTVVEVLSPGDTNVVLVSSLLHAGYSCTWPTH